MKTFLHFLGVLTRLQQPHSQVTENELAMLCRYVAGAESACEIGCYEGKTTVALANGVNGVVFTVDPFFRGRLGLSYTEWIARLHARRHGKGKVRFLRGLSHELAPQFREALDFLFIDADHSYPGVKQDWENWTPKLRSGGIVALHDARVAVNSPIRLGSMDFFEQEVATSPAVKIVDGVDSLVILRKNP